MSYYSSIAGARLIAGSIAIPLYGMWSADVTLAADDPIPDQVPLVVGNLELKGAVYRQGLFAGTRSTRLVGGFGGWRKVVPAKQYAFANGVNLSMILGDAALEVGEQVNVPNDRNVGTGYVRENRQASLVLRQLAGANWYVDPAGVTQVQAWPARRIASRFTVENQDTAGGSMIISTDDPASWMPGSTFDSPFLEGTYTVCGVLFNFKEDGTMRLHVLTQ